MKQSKVSVIALWVLALCLISLPTLAQNDAPVLHFGEGEDIGLLDSISFYVQAKLIEKGYELEVTSFADSSLIIESLSLNNIQFSTGSFQTAWNAIPNGAKITSIVQYHGMDFVMIGKTSLETCDDWEGTTIAYNGDTSLSTAIGNYYFDNVCTDYSPEVVYVRGSSNRVAALISGALDATIIRLDSALPILEESPEAFHLVADLSSDFPWMVGSGLHVSTEFAQAYPEVVQDVVVTYLEVLHEITDDSADFITFASDFLEDDPEKLQDILDIYVEADMFSITGGLTDEVVAQSLEFFINSGYLSDSLTVEDIVDLSFIEHAVAELDMDDE